MTYKRTFGGRLTSFLLVLAILLTMLPLTGIKVSAAISGSEIIRRVADPATLDGYKDYFALNGELNTNNAGGVWLDKSVLADNSAFAGVGITKDNPDGFLVALSTMAANMAVEGMSYVPTDSVLILDLSGSMNASNNDVAEDLVQAANTSIQTLLDANKYNRVGVILYSDNAVTFLPLNRYTTVGGSYLTYSQRGGTETISIDSDVVYEGTSTKPTSRSKNVSGATYIQGGIAGAVEQFVADSNSVTVIDPSAGTLRRKPVVVLMSDGAPTEGSSNFTNPADSDFGDGSDTSAGLSFTTQLTLAYARHQIEEKYGTEPLFYTLGLGVGDDPNATSVLDPANSSTAINNFWAQYTAADVGDEITVQSAYWLLFYQVPAVNVTKIGTELNKNYVDKYFEADDSEGSLADALKGAFADIMDTIQIQSGYYPTLISANEDLSGYVSFVDRIGHGMTVTDIKGVLIGDHLFSGADLASNFVPSGGLLGTATNPTALGREMVAAVQARLGIESMDVAEALIALAYQHGQLSYESANNYSNYIGWYANAAGKFLGFYNEGTTVLPEATGDAATDPAFVIRSYGYLGEVDEAHGVSKSDMMYATVQIRKNLQNGDEIVTFAVPAALIPTLTYNVKLDEDGGLSDLTATGAKKPIRLVYEVALEEELNLFNLKEYLGEEYLSETHHIGTDGSVYFFTNKWDHHNVTGYGTNNTYAYFNPSRQNDKYYYLEDTPIYQDQNGTLYTGASQPDRTMYRRYTVYAKDGSSLSVRTVYRAISAPVLATAKRADDNTWYVPMGDVHTNLDGYTVAKAGNDTATLPQAVVPFVDTKNHSINDTGYRFYVGATLGNNGKLVVKPETGIKLTKEMAEENSNVTEAFSFTLEMLEGDGNKTYPALLVDPNGKENNAEVTFTNGAAIVELRPGYALYIGGMAAGNKVRVTEKNDLKYIPMSNGLDQNGTVTLTDGNMAPVEFINAVRGLGNLTITKEIVHPLGNSYAIPAGKAFTFRVTLLGELVQNATFKASHTNGTVEEVKVIGGQFTVQLENNESLEIFEIPEGTDVIVEEINTPEGFTVFYMDNGEQGDGRVAIEKDLVATVVATNVYAPAAVDPIPIGVSGVKTLSGREWTATDSFEFQLQKLTGPNTWQQLGESEYATKDSKTFTFDYIFDNASYTEAGTYYYRIVEVEPTTPLGGISYDKTVHSFYVTVTDEDMDGKLEITKVKTDRPDTTHITGNGTSWEITADFENTYFATGTTTVTVDVNKEIANLGGSEKHPAGFEFGIFDAEGNLVGQTLTTTERGFARFALRYTEADAGQVFTYTLKEIVPATIPAGWTYSTEEVALTVKVNDNGDGTISAVIYEGAEEPAAPGTSVETLFTNTYAPAKATLPVNFVKKTVNNEIPGDRIFTFQVEGNGVILTGSNDENGNVTFNGALEFSAVGTYRFTITETSQDGNGISTDKTHYTMLVTVTDDEKGQLVADYALENVPGKTLTINNTYTARPTGYAITGEKNLTGRTLLNDEFTFIMKEISVNGAAVSDPATYEVKNFLDGTFSFPEYIYREEGVYVYEVAEKQAEGETLGITYDKSVYTVTVTVTDNGQGRMVVNADYETNGQSADALVFNNRYVAKPTSVVFTGDKELTGKVNNTLEGDEFRFELYKSDANWNLGALKETVSNQAGGAFRFTKIDFETDDDQYFIVKEQNAGQNIDGVTYDTTEFRVYVEVIDDLKGQLHTVVNIFDGNGVPQDSIKFTNIYEVTGTEDVILSGEKVLSGRDWKENDSFTFNLYKADERFAFTEEENSLLATANVSSTARRFEMHLEYTAQDVGKVFHYALVEAPGNIPGVTYDETVYHITVAVTDNGQGGIATHIVVENAAVDTLNFINIYTPEPADVVIEGTKKLSGRDLVEGEFLFLAYQTGADFQIAEGAQPFATNNGEEGKFSFVFNATQAGTYYFVVREDTSVRARLVTFDRSVYWVTVEVKDENGQLVAGDPVITLENSTEPVEEIVFQNAYNPNIPQTGDDRNLTLWVTLMVLSVLAAAALLVFEKRRTQA